MPFDAISYALAKRALRRALTPRLSDLVVDVDKDWAKKNIVNFGPNGIDLHGMVTSHANRHVKGGADEVLNLANINDAVGFSLEAHASRHAVGGADEIPDNALNRAKISDFFNSPFWDNIPDKPNTFPTSLAISGLASSFENESDVDGLAKMVELLNEIDLLATIFNHTNLSADKAASIFRSDNISLSRIYDILSSNIITGDRVQSILYSWVESLDKISKLIDLLTITGSDVILSSNATYTGFNVFSSLDLNGYTYTADGQPHVIVAKTINIPSASSIIKTPTGGLGGQDAYGSKSGGNGGGGLIIIANTINIYGSISANAENGVDHTSAPGSGAGEDGGSGLRIILSEDLYNVYGGDGGDIGGVYCSGGGGGAPNGDGGSGGNGGYNGGNGGPITTITFDTAKDMLKEVLKYIVDLWIQNVLGKSLTSPKVMDIKGAGGGSGGSTSSISHGGGGGGQGGEVIIFAFNLDFTGSISARGGDGGNGWDRGTDYSGGGGSGAGGLIYLLYVNSVNLTGSFNVSRGALGCGTISGSTTNCPYPGLYGTYGKARTIHVSIT